MLSQRKNGVPGKHCDALGRTSQPVFFPCSSSCFSFFPVATPAAAPGPQWPGPALPLLILGQLLWPYWPPCCPLNTRHILWPWGLGKDTLTPGGSSLSSSVLSQATFSVRPSLHPPPGPLPCLIFSWALVPLSLPLCWSLSASAPKCKLQEDRSSQTFTVTATIIFEV